MHLTRPHTMGEIRMNNDIRCCENMRTSTAVHRLSLILLLIKETSRSQKRYLRIPGWVYKDIIFKVTSRYAPN